MEFMVQSVRLVVEEKLPMEESREHRIQELLKLEQARQESILLTDMVQRRLKDWVERHGKHKVFKKGDQVLVSNSRVGKHQGKLGLRWMDPYVIEEEVSPTTFMLRNLDKFVNKSTVNGHRLKPYYSPGVLGKHLHKYIASERYL